MVRHVPDIDEVRHDFHESIAVLVRLSRYVFFWGVSESSAAHDYLVVTQTGSLEDGFPAVRCLQVDLLEWLNGQESQQRACSERIREFLLSPTWPSFKGTLTWDSSAGTFLCDTLPSVEFDLIAPISFLSELRSDHSAALRIAKEIRDKGKKIRHLQRQIEQLESEVTQLRDEALRMSTKG
jgi:hypothetical protein